MDKNVFEIICECYKNVLEEAGIQKEITSETPVMGENGLDSMDIVNLIIEMEEHFNLDLDQYLLEIRNAKDIAQLVKIVEEIR